MYIIYATANIHLTNLVMKGVGHSGKSATIRELADVVEGSIFFATWARLQRLIF